DLTRFRRVKDELVQCLVLVHNPKTVWGMGNLGTPQTPPGRLRPLDPQSLPPLLFLHKEGSMREIKRFFWNLSQEDQTSHHQAWVTSVCLPVALALVVHALRLGPVRGGRWGDLAR